MTRPTEGAELAVLQRVEPDRERDREPPVELLVRIAGQIEHDNPEIRHTDELCRFLGQLYNRDVTETDTVTVIRFSAIKPSYGF